MNKYKVNWLSIIYQVFSIVSLIIAFGVLIYFVFNNQFIIAITYFSTLLFISLIFITISELIKILCNIRENTEKVIDKIK